MIKRVAAVAIGIALAVSGAVAQEEEDRDFFDVSIFGGLTLPGSGMSDWRDTLAAESGYNVGVELGYFVTPSFVLGPTFHFSQFGVDATNEAADQNHRIYAPGLVARYYFFGESFFAPYLRAEVGINFYNFVEEVLDNNSGSVKYRQIGFDPAFSAAVGAGLLWFTSDFSGIFLEANYHLGFSDSVEGTFQDQTFIYGENAGYVTFKLGVRAFFGNY